MNSAEIGRQPYSGLRQGDKHMSRPYYSLFVVIRGSARRSKPISKGRRRHIIARDGRCVLCGAGENLTVHHIRPRVWGGGNSPDNLITVCHSCHMLMNDAADRLAQLLLYVAGLLLFRRRHQGL